MVESFMDLAWCDLRLASDSQQSGTPRKAFLEVNAQAGLDEIWWPDPRIVNAVGTLSVGNDELTVKADSTTEYKESFSGQVSKRLAATVDTASRLAFPLIYVVGLVALVGVYLL